MERLSTHLMPVNGYSMAIVLDYKDPLVRLKLKLASAKAQPIKDLNLHGHMHIRSVHLYVVITRALDIAQA